MRQVQAASEARIRGAASQKSRAAAKNGPDTDFAALLSEGTAQNQPVKTENKDGIKKTETENSKQETPKTPVEDEKTEETVSGSEQNQQALDQLLALQNGFAGMQQVFSLPKEGDLSNLLMGGITLQGAENTAGQGMEEGMAGVWQDAAPAENEGLTSQENPLFVQENLTQNTAEAQTGLVQDEQAAKEPEAETPAWKAQKEEGFSGLPGEEKTVNPGQKMEQTNQEGANRSFTGGQEAAAASVQSNFRSLQNTAVRADSAQPSFSQGMAETVLQMQTSVKTLGSDTAQALISNLPLKNGELELELEPVSLGKLTLKVAYDGGRAAVTVMASNPRTLEILSQNAGQIAQILEEHTGQQTMVYTPQQPQDDAQQGQGGQAYEQDRQERRHQRKESDSFAQQLRLGLV